MSGVDQRVVYLLEAHRLGEAIGDTRAHCRCKWQSVENVIRTDAHRAHLAEVIEAHYASQDREREALARGWDEALAYASSQIRERVDGMVHSSWVAGWLTDQEAANPYRAALLDEVER